MAETEKFYSSLPHINIITIGHVDHGKTTLTSAILSVLSKEDKKGAVGEKKARRMSYQEIDDVQGSKSTGSKQRGKTINASHVEFFSDKRHYALIDCPGHEDYIKNMITGAAQGEGAILVISSTEGSQVQTDAHMILAKQVGIKHLVVFINDKTEKGLDDDSKDVAKMDIREKLVEYGYEKKGEETTPIIFASAKKALEGDPEEEKKISNPKWKETNSSKGLVEILDEYIPIPERDVNKPFLMWVESKYSVNAGTVVTGKVGRGKLKKGDEIEIIGMGRQKKKVKAKEIQVFHREKDTAVTGDDVGICLSGIKIKEVERGQVLAAPGTVTSHTKVLASAYIYTPEERGRRTFFEDGFRPQFFFNTADVTGTIKLDSSKVVNPGDTVNFEIDLGDKDVVIEKNSNFIIWEGNTNVGKGVVTEIIK
ncbi:MAG: translation elongation factor Tu [Mycoplasmataceae bacterium RC_NB112A]|nr:MAG: translation elongation factor Tu [Mycoplasmataceae bacterium RC_NB112A]